MPISFFWHTSRCFIGNNIHSIAQFQFFLGGHGWQLHGKLPLSNQNIPKSPQITSHLREKPKNNRINLSLASGRGPCPGLASVGVLLSNGACREGTSDKISQ